MEVFAMEDLVYSIMQQMHYKQLFKMSYINKMYYKIATNISQTMNQKQICDDLNINKGDCNKFMMWEHMFYDKKDINGKILSFNITGYTILPYYFPYKISNGYYKYYINEMQFIIFLNEVMLEIHDFDAFLKNYKILMCKINTFLNKKTNSIY